MGLLPVKIIIADDEPGVLLLLCSILRDIDDTMIVGTAENANDAIKLTKEKQPEVAFLDIGLPDMIGIELANKLKEINPDIFIVFVTAYQEYSLDAFKLYAFDYILKPIDEERVKTTFSHIYNIIKKSNKDNRNLQASTISISFGNERVFVKLRDIFYIEKIGRHTFIHSINGEFKTRETLKELEKWCGSTFFRSHKSYIINTKKIERIISYTNYYEVKFKSFKNTALLSRDRRNELIAHLDCNLGSREGI